MQQKFAGLNKEFERRDVERMRNLIKGKANSSSENQVGYHKKTIERKEGDIWKPSPKNLRAFPSFIFLFPLFAEKTAVDGVVIID